PKEGVARSNRVGDASAPLPPSARPAPRPEWQRLILIQFKNPYSVGIEFQAPGEICVRDHKPISVENLLAHVPLFDGLGAKEIADITCSTREIKLQRGDMLFHRGDPCTGFHILVYGQVKLAFTSTQGTDKVVDIVSDGQSFGEAIMFADKA